MKTKNASGKAPEAFFYDLISDSEGGNRTHDNTVMNRVL